MAGILDRRVDASYCPRARRATPARARTGPRNDPQAALRLLDASTPSKKKKRELLELKNLVLEPDLGFSRELEEFEARWTDEAWGCAGRR